MTNHKLIAFLLCPLALLAAPDLVAQTALQGNLLNCAEVTDVLQRLSCYDDLARKEAATIAPAPAVQPEAATTQPAVSTRQVEPAAPVTTPIAPPVITRPANRPSPQIAAPASSDAPQKQVQTFGQEPARVETTDSNEQVLIDTITAVKQVEPTKILITLASGQVWRQTVGKRYIVRKGDKVRISSSSWGDDFRLSVEGKKGFIQVSRVQ